MPLKEGDIIINKKVFEFNSSKKGSVLSDEQIKKNIENIKAPAKTFEKPADAEAIVALAQNDDGSIKWTFDNIYQNKDLAKVAKNYYEERTGNYYNEREAIDKFIWDRTFKQSNTFSMGKEYAYITGKNVGADQKARLAYLTRTWAELPDFYQEGGRGFSGFAANLGAAVLDPLNLVGGVVGGMVGRRAAAAVGSKALKEATKKGIKKAGKDIFTDQETFASLAEKAAKSNVLKSSGTIAAIDSVGFAAADIAAQTTEKEIGLRQKLDFKRTALVSIAAGGTSFIATGGVGLATQKLRNVSAAKEATNLKASIKKGANLTDESLNSEVNVTKTGNYIKSKLADQYDFVKTLQKNILGVEGSAAGLKSAVKSGKFDIDPVLMPYFQLRMSAAASTRAHEFLMRGWYMPPSATAKSASYTKGNSKGLQEIIMPFDKVRQTNSFLLYGAAKRQQGILKAKPNLKEKLPLTKDEMQQAIDYGELSPSQYKNKYKVDLLRNGDFRKGLAELKIFTDEALEYQVLSGLISRETAENVKEVNPYFVPFYRGEKGPVKSILEKLDPWKKTTLKEQTDKVLRTARPGAKALSKDKLEGTLNLYDNLTTYVYKVLNGSDRNRAKLALYDMIAKAKKLKQIAPNAVVKRARLGVEEKTIIGKNIQEKFKEAGISLIKAGKDIDTLDNLNTLAFSGTFKKSSKDNFIDLVYRNGNQEAYEILNPHLAEAFIAFGDDAAKDLLKMPFFGAGGVGSGIARFSSRAITYSPPFVAFNIIRDTLAGTVNSVFGIVNREGVGFVPGWSTAKGLYKSYQANDVYRKALISGMGYSSRSDMETLITNASADMLKYGSKREVGQYRGALKHFLKKMKAGWRGYADFVSRVEYATRLGEFELAKNAGMSDLASSFLGREVATDFGMRGSSQFLNLLSRNTMFLNAGIQGLYRTGRLAVEGTPLDKAKVGLTIGGTIVLPELYLYQKNKNIPEYWRLDERVRQLNYVIPTYENINGQDVFDGFLYVPKPYDLGFFANAATALVMGIEGKGNEYAQRYALQSLGNIIPYAPIPQIINPAVELLFNKNLYSGSAVLGFYEQRTISSLRSRPQTRKIANVLYNFLVNMRGTFTIGEKGGEEKEAPFNLDPIKIDYLLGSYAVGLMQYPIDALNAALYENIDKEKSPGTYKVRKGVEKVAKILLPESLEYKADRPGLNALKAAKRGDEIDIKNPLSIVTRRFKSEVPIKNSFYHKEWYRIQERARELKLLDFTNIDASRTTNSKLLNVFDRIITNIDNDDPLISDEMKEYVMVLGPTFNAMKEKLQEFRELRKTIQLAPGMSPEDKLETLNTLLAGENMMLEQYLKTIADMDLEYVLRDTMVWGTLYRDTFPGKKSKKETPSFGLKEIE